ncbi:hypothetical protein CVT24_001449 [Panaeolus cyanescens]|uniref:Uncharacterized protein n=1 Tax=Panaeolus cyanescens TaxID=181874 RepID=A0A409WSG6_9AGAR|nr:hypothetical protein CVT24_001449 [Panaeolus cyanescens]
MDFDASWCPTCDRQIQPKRYTITTTTQQMSPTKKGAKRQIKKPILKQKTIIDQGPTPLYCSEECQLADLCKRPRDIPIQSPTTSTSESEQSPVESSYDKLARMYNFPPLPPPPPVIDATEDIKPTYEYTSGIMMAGKLIDSLCTKPSKHTGPYRPAPERKVVPGWNDGSNAWRASVYSFASPKSAQDPFQEIKQKAYGSPATSSYRRPTKVYSSCSLPAVSTVNVSAHSASDDLIHKFSETFARRSESRISMHNPTPSRSSSSTVGPSSPTSTRSVPLSPKRERSLVAKGAEGRLCVPEGVTLKVRTTSSSSVCSSGNTASSRSRSVRSPLSATSVSSEDDEEAVMYPFSRPKVETRSWSYDNLKTYPIMQLPPKKIKKTERQLIDGVEQDVEVEVEVYEERKRLFLFAPSTRVTV